MLPEKQQIARGIIIHGTPVLFDCGYTLDSVCQAELFLAGKLWESKPKQVLIQQRRSILINDRCFIF